MARKPDTRLFPLLLALLIPGASAALEFPDTVQLKRDWRLVARTPGDARPALFCVKKGGDSATLALEWARGLPAAARYEQDHEFDQDAFTKLTESFGNGGAWHELPDPAGPEAKRIYPGLQQQWLLKGYSGEQGWLGSGVLRGRYFLVFRESPPAAMAAVAGPLRLNRAWFAFLDTSSQWLHVPCGVDSSAGGRGAGPKGPRKPVKGRNIKATPGGKSLPVCFSPGDDSRLRVRIDGRAPLAVDVWLEEEESESLRAIRKAVQTVSDASQHEYSQDMSQILLGEGQMFLVKLAQRAPGLFNWPSWQLQDFKAGRISESRYLEIIRRESEPDDFLPALKYEDKGLRLSVDLYYRGAYHLKAEEIP